MYGRRYFIRKPLYMKKIGMYRLCDANVRQIEFRQQSVHITSRKWSLRGWGLRICASWRFRLFWGLGYCMNAVKFSCSFDCEQTTAKAKGNNDTCVIAVMCRRILQWKYVRSGIWNHPLWPGARLTLQCFTQPSWASKWTSTKLNSCWSQMDLLWLEAECRNEEIN